MSLQDPCTIPSGTLALRQRWFGCTCTCWQWMKSTTQRLDSPLVATVAASALHDKYPPPSVLHSTWAPFLSPCPPPGMLDNWALKVFHSAPKWRLELCCQAVLTTLTFQMFSCLRAAFAITRKDSSQSTTHHPQLGQPQAHSLSTNNQPVLVPSCYCRWPQLNTSFTSTCVFTSSSRNYV